MNDWSDEDWRDYFDERAAIYEFDAGLPRDEAEARASDEVAWMKMRLGCFVKSVTVTPKPSEE